MIPVLKLIGDGHLMYNVEIYTGLIPRNKPSNSEVSPANGRRVLVKNDFLWNKVKEAFAKDRIEANIFSVGMLRSTQVNGMLSDMGNRTKYAGLTFNAIGSTNATSDYDITVGGNRDIEALVEFNQDFREWIKKVAKEEGKVSYPSESGMVFDTNLYVAGYLPVSENVRSKTVAFASLLREFSASEVAAAQSARLAAAGVAASKARSGQDGQQVLWDGVTEQDFLSVSPKVRELSEECQDVYALTKLRKYCSAVEWGDFKNELKKTMKASDWDATEKRLIRAEGLVDEYVTKLLSACNKLNKNDSPDQREKTLADYEETSDIEANAVLAARNKLYAEYSIEARQNFRKYKRDFIDRSNLDAAAEKLRKTSYDKSMDTFALSLMFAMEAYHSGSAIKDVVGNQQGKKGVKLTRSEYRDSFNEQVGDFLKDMHHYKDPAKALIQASKYLSRFCFAANWIDKISSCKLSATDRKLMDAFTKLTSKDPDSVLLQLRKPEPIYALMTEEARSQEAVKFYGSTMGNVYNKEEMRKKIMQLAVAVNTNSRRADCTST